MNKKKMFNALSWMSFGVFFGVRISVQFDAAGWVTTIVAVFLLVGIFGAKICAEKDGENGANQTLTDQDNQ